MHPVLHSIGLLHHSPYSLPARLARRDFEEKLKASKIKNMDDIIGLI
jgi:hypothetical protein